MALRDRRRKGRFKPDAVVDAMNYKTQTFAYQGLDLAAKVMQAKLNQYWIVDPASKTNPEYQVNPAKWVYDNLGYELKRKQPEIMKALAGAPPYDPNKDVAVMSGHKCFAAGTLVLTENGFEPIENIHKGTLVLTHKNRWMPVTATHQLKGKTVVLKGTGHHGIKVTKDHKFLSPKGWERADEIKEWSTPTEFEELHIPFCAAVKHVMNEDFFRFVGYWLGNGSYNLTKRKGRKDSKVYALLMTCGHHKKKFVSNRIKAAGFKSKANKQQTAYVFPIYSKELCFWFLANFGRYAHGKRLPSWVYGMRESFRRALLSGYLEADGHWIKGHKDTRWMAKTNSKELALGIRMLAASLGIFTGLYQYTRKAGQIEGRQTRASKYWVVACNGSEGRGSCHRHVKGRFYSKVKGISKESKKEVDVYTLTVSEDHSYVVEGLIVKNCGKTFTLACCVLWWLDTKEMSKVLTTAPGKRQLKHILWAEIGHLFRRMKRRHIFEMTAGMHIYNRIHPEDWMAMGIFSNEADRIEGFSCKERGKLLTLVDEGKAVDDPFFNAMTSMVGKRMVASVPPLNGIGYFCDIFKKFRPLWHCFHMSSLDSPFVTDAWVAARRVDWVEGSAIWQSKVLGQVPTVAASDLVIAPQDVDAAQARWTSKDVDQNYMPVVGCDTASYGDDNTVDVTLRGYRMAGMHSVNGRDEMGTVGALIERASREAHILKEGTEAENFAKEIPIWVDDTSVGGGVTSRLKELEYNVTSVRFGNAANNPIYKNKASELWFDLADDMGLLQVIPDDACNSLGAKLFAELVSRTFKYTSNGKIIQPKELLKKKLGRSPDHADALAIANGARRALTAGPSFGIDTWT